MSKINKGFIKEGNVMALIGIIKEVDKLGRIVIPKELRERFGVTKRAEIVATEFGIVIKSPDYKLVKTVRAENWSSE